MKIKHFFIALFFSLAAFAVQAQESEPKFELGITAGLNQSNRQGQVFLMPFKSGMNIGVTGAYRLKTSWKLHSALLFSQKGYQIDVWTGANGFPTEIAQALYSFRYLNLPVYVSYEKHLIGRLSAYPLVGFFQEIFLNKDITITKELPEGREFTTHDFMNTYQAGLLVGAGFHYALNSGISLRAEYKLEPSLTLLEGPVFDFTSGGNRNLNTAFNFTVSYKPDFKR